MKKVMKKLFMPVVLVGAMVISATPAFAHIEVEKGDTLGKIADEHNTTVDALVQVNPNIKDVNLIYVGQTIKTAETASKSVVSQSTSRASVGVDADTIQVFAQLVQAEAGNESYAGKVAVASVVLNRVDSSEFPDSISEVIYQSGQFSPVTNGMIYKPASADAKRAVVDAMASRSDHTSLFFYNPRVATSRWLDGRQTTYVMGNHTFKR